MNLHTLTKVTGKNKKRVGQGHGSGRVKTSGRGTKGQKARRNIPLYFEGGALPLIKRLPFQRGKDRNKSFREKEVIINVSDLNKLKTNSKVDVAVLAENGLIHATEVAEKGIKILGNGDLTVALTVMLPVSKGAQAKIEKAGGNVTTE